MKCSRRTIIRQRQAMGLERVEHPEKEGRLGETLIKASYIRRLRAASQAEPER